MPTVFDKAYRHQSFGFGDFLVNGLHLALRGISHTWAYEDRITRARAISHALLSRLAHQRRRVDDNLKLIYPEMTPDWRAEIRAETFRNIGQSMMEHIHMEDFADRIGFLNISGDGVTELDAERGAILVSGHFGQWEGIRIAWRHLTGQDCAFFFRPHNNGFYDRAWQGYLRRAGEPVIPKGGDGKAAMQAHLSRRGAMLMVIDQRIRKAEPLDFMGHPARTATTAADLALHYDLPLIPAYAIRRDTLLEYDVVFEDPIPQGDPVAMTQALNDSLAARIRANPEQYLWTHRRWR